LVPLDTTIEYIYECDTELLRLRKYIYPKPPIVPLPVHPFTVTLDYPALRRIFKGNENKRLGHFSLPRGTWTKRPKHMHIPIVDSIRIRNWIFAELMKNWTPLEIEVFFCIYIYFFIRLLLGTVTRHRDVSSEVAKANILSHSTHCIRNWIFANLT
jgi:hypothetical protein